MKRFALIAKTGPGIFWEALRPAPAEKNGGKLIPRAWARPPVLVIPRPACPNEALPFNYGFRPKRFDLMTLAGRSFFRKRKRFASWSRRKAAGNLFNATTEALHLEKL